MKIRYMYCILNIWVNFNSKVPQEGFYPNIKFERDRLNIFQVRVFTSSGSTGGSDAKTITISHVR